MFKKLFSINNIVLYILMFMISKTGFVAGVTPFAIAITAAACSNEIPLAPILIFAGLGSFLGFGQVGLITYFLGTLILILFAVLIKPRRNENETLKLGSRLFVTVILLQVLGLVFKNIIVYDLLTSCIFVISTLIFYKIFVNSILVIKEYTIKDIFTSEEIVGATLMVAIALSAVPEILVLGVSIKIIAAILFVIFIGIQNGILIGATSGITVGIILRNIRQ